MPNVEPNRSGDNFQALPLASGSLLGTLEGFSIGRDSQSCWRDLKRTIQRLIETSNARRLLEIGGGRFPYLSVAEVEAMGCELTVNDISQSELDRAPDAFHKSCFDIASDLPDHAGRGEYDFLFSRMVFEHVRDGRRAWTNCLNLLRPGGIAFTFVPTLWSPPFVVNRIFPEDLSARLLSMIDADRSEEKVPKFPAFYELCRGDAKVVTPVLKQIGFSDVAVIPFFGTPYLPVVPVVKHIARAVDRMIDRFDMKTFSSYAYIVARK